MHFLDSTDPCSTTTCSSVHRWISLSQCGSVDSGATTRNGGRTRYPHMTACMNSVDCNVFPRPISSARMLLRPFTQFHSSQLIPSAW